MEKKEVIIFIHGFKTKDINDFDEFVNKYKSKLTNKELVNFDFYDSNKKETINKRNFDLKITEVFEKYKERKVKVIAYSFGSIVAMKNSLKYENIDDIYLVVPALYIHYMDWISSIKKNKSKLKKLKKKLGKERFDSFMKNNSVSKNYSLISRTVHKYIKANRKHLKKLKNKNIYVSYSEKDTISNNDKVIPFIKKELEKNNKVIFNKVEETHFSILKSEKNNKHIEDFINDKV